jgi:hypothetical protein
VQGHLPSSQADYFFVSFTGNSNVGYHPTIILSGDAGIVFDVYSDSNCGSDMCGLSITTWEVYYPPNPPQPYGGNSFAAIPNVGANGTVYIKVFRATGSPTCNSYTLAISNP